VRFNLLLVSKGRKPGSKGIKGLNPPRGNPKKTLTLSGEEKGQVDGALALLQYYGRKIGKQGIN